MGSEFELKYRATPQILTTIQAAVEGSVTHFQMRTDYYDTADRTLSAKHWTLRRRLENETAVCTLKMPGKDGDRREFEVECDSIIAAIPELCKLAESSELIAHAAKGLMEICGAAFHRIAVTVQLENAVAEVALDQGVLLGGGKELPFAEVEVELKSGDRGEVIAFANALSSRFGLEPEPQSKFRRASLLTGGN